MRRVHFKFRHHGDILDADLLIATATEWRAAPESQEERWSVCPIARLMFALRLPLLPDLTGRNSTEADGRAPLGADSYVDGNGPDLKRLI